MKEFPEGYKVRERNLFEKKINIFGCAISSVLVPAASFPDLRPGETSAPAPCSCSSRRTTVQTAAFSRHRSVHDLPLEYRYPPHILTSVRESVSYISAELICPSAVPRPAELSIAEVERPANSSVAVGSARQFKCRHLSSNARCSWGAEGVLIYKACASSSRSWRCILLIPVPGGRCGSRTTSHLMSGSSYGICP